MVTATAIALDTYDHYGNLLETIEDISISTGDKEKLMTSVGILAKAALPPRITYLFRGINLYGPCDILFSFEPRLLNSTAVYEREKLSDFVKDLDTTIFQDDLVTRLFKNEFCKSIILDRTSQSLIVNFPVGEVVKGGSWQRDCCHDISRTLNDHGYREPVYRDGKYLH